ncbi:MAG: DNA-binding protein [Ignavibacteriae bacterium HGW-Ignavibacteriae-3]|nr:MAG: DNA-binding protein [Ignavibacteriae bacterium HGW-Ignavibacteriae-3]
MQKIGIIGSGVVGKTLANGFLRHGYSVKVGTSNAEKLSEWKSNAGTNASVGSFSEAASFGDIIVLAVKGNASLEAVKKSNPSALTGKTVIDATNPIADAPPQNGVLKFFTDLNESLMEKLQQAYPDINFVKAFSCVGNAFMVNPDFPGGKPTMFICGNNEESKSEVKIILDKFGWETEDMGKAESARAIEPLCILWCIPGIQKGQWMHAFKLLKM